MNEYKFHLWKEKDTIHSFYTYIHDKAKGRKLGKISGNIKNSG